ncbi:MAG: hypothetical protein WC150_08580 [Bacteroidia bacterium]
MKLFLLLFCFLPVVTLAQKPFNFNFCGHSKSLSITELKQCPRLVLDNDSVVKISSMFLRYELDGEDHTEMLPDGLIKQNIIATFERHRIKSFTIFMLRGRATGADKAYPFKTGEVTFELTH